MKEYLCELFSDPSFMGALLGALITGMITLAVFKLGNIYNEKQKEIHRKKTYKRLKQSLDIAYMNIENFKLIIEGELIYNEHEISMIANSFSRAQDEIKEMSISDYPDEIYDEFIEMQTALDNVRILGNIYVAKDITIDIKNYCLKEISKFINNYFVIKKYFK